MLSTLLSNHEIRSIFWWGRELKKVNFLKKKNMSSQKLVHECSQQCYSYIKKAETTQMSINWWINKMWYIHTMEYYFQLRGNKKEWTTSTCYNMDEHYAKWMKAVTKDHIWYDSTRDVQNKQIYRLARARGRVGGRVGGKWGVQPMHRGLLLE